MQAPQVREATPVAQVTPVAPVMQGRLVGQLLQRLLQLTTA